MFDGAASEQPPLGREDFAHDDIANGLKALTDDGAALSDERRRGPTNSLVRPQLSGGSLVLSRIQAVVLTRFEELDCRANASVYPRVPAAGTRAGSLLISARHDHRQAGSAVGVDRECRRRNVAEGHRCRCRLASADGRDAWDVAIATAAHEPDLVVFAGFIILTAVLHDSTGAILTTRRCCLSARCR